MVRTNIRTAKAGASAFRRSAGRTLVAHGEGRRTRGARHGGSPNTQIAAGDKPEVARLRAAGSVVAELERLAGTRLRGQPLAIAAHLGLAVEGGPHVRCGIVGATITYNTLVPGWRALVIRYCARHLLQQRGHHGRHLGAVDVRRTDEEALTEAMLSSCAADGCVCVALPSAAAACGPLERTGRVFATVAKTR
jgi:3-oxoacyl-ACP reductase-like protein